MSYIKSAVKVVFQKWLTELCLQYYLVYILSNVFIQKRALIALFLRFGWLIEWLVH